MQAAYSPGSPSSPVRSRKTGPIPGFRVPPKPKAPPIEELTIRELRDLYDRNAKILATPSVSVFVSVRPFTSDAYILTFIFFN
jgi:hypothetical protein